MMNADDIRTLYRRLQSHISQFGPDSLYPIEAESLRDFCEEFFDMEHDLGNAEIELKDVQDERDSLYKLIEDGEELDLEREALN